MTWTTCSRIIRRLPRRSNRPRNRESRRKPTPARKTPKPRRSLNRNFKAATIRNWVPQRPAMNVPLGRNEVLIRADQQEKNQDIYTGRGHVEIRFGTSTLHADEVIYDASTGQLTASGHVVFDGGRHNEHLVGTHATYDISRDTGTFYDVTGSSGVRVKNKVMFLTSSTPFFFTGKVVDKLGPDRYRVNYGFVTSCRAAQSQVEVGFSSRRHRNGQRSSNAPCHSEDGRHSRSSTFPMRNIRRQFRDARAAF